MIISWIEKLSLLDYPWKIACIVFTPWCNLRCKYCHNSQFVLPEKLKNIKDMIPENIFFNFLKTKIGKIEWVSICWWEPTLQKDLIDFCKKVKELWFLLKLDTNWQNPIKIKSLIDNNLVDYIAMDIKTTPKKWENLCWVKENFNNYIESINFIINSNIDYEFRTTIVKWYHKVEDIKEICSFIKWAKAYNLQNYRSWNTLIPNFDWLSFTTKELQEFKNIILKEIKTCIIRE